MRPDQWLVVIFICLLLYSCYKGTEVHYQKIPQDDLLKEFSEGNAKDQKSDVKILRIIITNKKE